VIRISDFREIRLVTRPAIGRRPGKLTSLMAEKTICREMRPREREIRFVMIEGGRIPSRRGVARSTIVRELVCLMIRVLRCREISLMTAVAIRRKTGIAAVSVARPAQYCRVSSGQRECRFRMIERRGFPYGRGMTRCAVM
jgi:hypothetical protein